MSYQFRVAVDRLTNSILKSLSFFTHHDLFVSGFICLYFDKLLVRRPTKTNCTYQTLSKYQHNVSVAETGLHDCNKILQSYNNNHVDELPVPILAGRDYYEYNLVFATSIVH